MVLQKPSAIPMIWKAANKLLKTYIISVLDNPQVLAYGLLFYVTSRGIQLNEFFISMALSSQHGIFTTQEFATWNIISCHMEFCPHVQVCFILIRDLLYVYLTRAE